MLRGVYIQDVVATDLARRVAWGATDLARVLLVGVTGLSLLYVVVRRVFLGDRVGAGG